jgi:molecular chaperone GrpE
VARQHKKSDGKSDDKPIEEAQAEPIKEEAQAESEVTDSVPPAEPSYEIQLETALAAEHDKYLRLAAEYDNYRKRSQKEREALYADARAETVKRLLPVYDNLARALAQQCTDEGFFKGIDMTMTKFRELLSGMGVEEIAARDVKFDPEKHEAVHRIEDPELGEQVITQEFEKGFTIGDKVIRHSKVQVAN